jgi:hypothetical protein
MYVWVCAFACAWCLTIVYFLQSATSPYTLPTTTETAVKPARIRKLKPYVSLHVTTLTETLTLRVDVHSHVHFRDA